MAMRKTMLLGLSLPVMLGGLLGVGSFTFHYGEGWSYFSTDPTTCVNCHIMQPHYDTWQKSSHHAVATCVDCHLPHDFPHKYIAKADNGFNHSWAFTFQDFHEPIEIKPRNRRILEQNCRHCHEAMVHQMLAHHEAVDRADMIECVHCHAGVGHTLPPR